MKFRYKRGIPVPYARQGYIYFKSLRFSGLPVREQERIRRLCARTGWGATMARRCWSTSPPGRR